MDNHNELVIGGKEASMLLSTRMMCPTSAGTARRASTLRSIRAKDNGATAQPRNLNLKRYHTKLICQEQKVLKDGFLGYL